MIDGESESAAQPQRPVWTSTRRFWVSLILVFHLFCVALAPLAVVDPAPGLAISTQRALSPYSESLFLMHGYRFFAPEPGPSHIVHYRVTTQSGETVEGKFPERGIWPRLMYHRWFMLSESMFQHVSETLDETQLAEWQTQINEQIAGLQTTNPRAAQALQSQLNRELQQHERISQMRDRLVVSIGKTLLRKHDGVSVDLKLVTRLIPPPQDIAMGAKLDNEIYMPADLTYSLGVVYSDSDQLESIAPQESDEEQGSGESAN